MEIKVQKIAALILCICICVTSISAEAKTKKTTGKDGKCITWNYDKETKTLTFSGKGPISDYEMDGHSAEPEWYVWSEKAEHIVVEEGITVIGEMACYHFLNVKNVKLPETLVKINHNAFMYDLELKTINFPDSLESIGSYAFSECEKMELPVLPSKLKKIGKGAFEDCLRIKNFIFPEDIRIIDEDALIRNINLRSVKLPQKVKKIMGGAFYNCKNLKVIDIPESVTTVAMAAFAGTGIRKLALPNNLKKIQNGDYGHKVFEKKHGLFPTKNLRVIEIHSKKVTKIEKNSFGGLANKVVIKVPKSRKKKYTKMLQESGLSKKVKIKCL